MEGIGQDNTKGSVKVARLRVQGDMKGRFKVTWMTQPFKMAEGGKNSKKKALIYQLKLTSVAS